jgi:hypothetical protein
MFNPKYEFLGKAEYVKHLPHPVPASKAIPEWYKKMPKSRDQKTLMPRKELVWADEDAGGLLSGATMKQCIPVRDYLTSGYIVPLWCEITVSMENGAPFFGWIDKSPVDIAVHPLYQVMGAPIQQEQNAQYGLAKLLSPWGYKTPPGYSSLFFSPRYYKGLLEILPAIVDTDSQHEVNFPFIYHGNENEHNILRIGEPIIQVVPFKRESWTHTVKEGNFQVDTKFLSYVTEAYRKTRHKKKSFK